MYWLLLWLIVIPYIHCGVLTAKNVARAFYNDSRKKYDEYHKRHLVDSTERTKQLKSERDVAATIGMALGTIWPLTWTAAMLTSILITTHEHIANSIKHTEDLDDLREVERGK